MCINRLPSESDFDYKERLIVSKIDGEIDLDWSEIVSLLGVDCTPDHLRKVGRGIYEAYINRKSLSTTTHNNDYDRSLQSQRDELYMLKKQYSDQRREYLKLLDVDARWKNLVDVLKDSCDRICREYPFLPKKKSILPTEKEAILFLSDWHRGLKADNIFNEYNVQIMKERVSILIQKTQSYLSLHKPKVLHIVNLGDAANGAINVSGRVAAEEDTCDQIMNVSEMFAQLIDELYPFVETVIFHSTDGNHLRTIQNKKESIQSDNMEKLIPWWLKQRFKNYNDVIIDESRYHEFIVINSFGYNICSTHGNLDDVKNFGVMANTLFTQKYGIPIHYGFLGDKHHREEFEQFGIETTLCSSLCGTDEYANGLRKYAKPAQTMAIFSEDGKECTYNIKV